MAALALVPYNAMPHADIMVSLGCEETRSVFILVHLHCSVRKGTTFLASTLHYPIPHPLNRTRKRKEKSNDPSLSTSHSVERKSPFTLESGMKNDSKVKGLNIDD